MLPIGLRRKGVHTMPSNSAGETARMPSDPSIHLHGAFRQRILCQ
jgi:hypothetical protein